jgi:hypothetical protein
MTQPSPTGSPGPPIEKIDYTPPGPIAEEYIRDRSPYAC